MDIWHEWGGDLAWSATGDLLTVDGSDKGRQRVLRRLLTNPDAYPFHPDYGAGLPLLVGEPDGAALAESRARIGMLREAAVAPDPAPEVSAVANDLGQVRLTIRYRDADTAAPVAIGFTVRE